MRERRTVIRHKFFDTIPDNLEDGVVHVSTTYATPLYLCCCAVLSQVGISLTQSSPLAGALLSVCRSRTLKCQLNAGVGGAETMGAGGP